MADQTQARLARESEAAQAASDIAHQRRESKLKELDTHLDVSRQLLLSMMQTGQTLLWCVGEWHAEDNPASMQQALGKKMVPMMAQDKQMLLGTPEMVEKLLAGENAYLDAQGDTCSTPFFSSMNGVTGMVGWIVAFVKSMCESRASRPLSDFTYMYRSASVSCLQNTFCSIRF